MERKTFRFENDQYSLARIQHLCFGDAGGGDGGVGPGTGRNESNPAGRGNRGNRSSGNASSRGGGGRDAANAASEAADRGALGASRSALGGSQAATRSAAAASGNTNSGGRTLGGSQAATRSNATRSTGSRSSSNNATRSTLGGSQAATRSNAAQSGNTNSGSRATPASNATRSNNSPALGGSQAATRSAVADTGPALGGSQQATRAALETPEATVGSVEVNNPGRTPGQRMAARFEPSALAGYMGLDDADRAANFDAPIGAEGSDEAPDGPQIDPQEKEDEEETVTDDSPQIETEPEIGGGSGYSGSSSGSSGSSGSSEAIPYDPVFGDSREVSVGSLLSALTDRGDSMDDAASSSEYSYGLEDTILSKRPLSDDALRRTFLTNLGARNLGTANAVVDPATGTVYRNPSQARTAGVTNWVYKYVFDAKRAGSSLYSAVIG